MTPRAHSRCSSGAVPSSRMSRETRSSSIPTGIHFGIYELNTPEDRGTFLGFVGTAIWPLGADMIAFISTEGYG